MLLTLPSLCSMYLLTLLRQCVLLARVLLSCACGDTCNACFITSMLHFSRGLPCLRFCSICSSNTGPQDVKRGNVFRDVMTWINRFSKCIPVFVGSTRYAVAREFEAVLQVALHELCVLVGVAQDNFQYSLCIFCSFTVLQFSYPLVVARCLSVSTVTLASS